MAVEVLVSILGLLLSGKPNEFSIQQLLEVSRLHALTSYAAHSKPPDKWMGGNVTSSSWFDKVSSAFTVT